MNLHIVPDNVFSHTFVNNLEEAGLKDNNGVVVRTNEKSLRYIKKDVPFAALYSRKFREYTSDTLAYNKVVIHQFTPLLYRWVALNQFNELCWAVWGADLYNLPFNQRKLYEPLTLSRFVNRNYSLQDFLYQIKVSLLHNPYRHAAYGKVRSLLTWMNTEFEFASQNLPSLKADHQFFFYENQLPYKEMDRLGAIQGKGKNSIPTYILGNSSTPELNHLDAVMWMQESGVSANLLVPVSYGNKRYADFLKRNLSVYKGGKIEFIDRYMNVHEYLNFLNSSDGLIMHNLRPQGYGNIFMMMYLGKPVFLNPRNLSAPELSRRNLKWLPIDRLTDHPQQTELSNRDALMSLLSHENLLKVYKELFS